jgi:RNA polymerase sigma-70 factor (family 1)
MHLDSLNKANDEHLLGLLGDGSKNAFDILYDRHWKLVYNAAYKRLNNTEYAQDIAQDVFIQLWTRCSTAPIENLPAYLLVAARNGVFKHMEKESRYAALPDKVEDLESPQGHADVDVLFKEFLTSFDQLIEALPAQQRIIFKMRFDEGLSSQQIADKLEISPKTVRNQIGKALQSLKASLLLQFVLLIAAQR